MFVGLTPKANGMPSRLRLMKVIAPSFVFKKQRETPLMWPISKGFVLDI
jgi:hypothetical protein